jgi:site-specific DNA-methyltransferase (adenine-specific)
MKPYFDHGGITVYHGDALDVLPSITADVTLTDPPYNTGMDYGDGYNDTRPDYAEWCRSWFALCPQPLVMTPGMVNLALWLAQERPRWVCAWVKPNQSSASALNGWNAWEPVLVYGKHRKPVGQDYWLVPVSQQREAEGHPCPKSVLFWRRLVSDFSLPTDVIADPFMGSGTTLVAAKALGRKAIGIERSERFCEMAVERLRQEQLPLEVA